MRCILRGLKARLVPDGEVVFQGRTYGMVCILILAISEGET